MKELLFIQQKLRVNKDKEADKGKYKYRTAEGILEAVKPLLDEQKCTIILNDVIWESSSGTYFLKATATLWNMQGKVAEAEGFAMLDEHKSRRYDNYTKEYVEVKSMSNEQATGSASSYARKYALCGLLAIDDSTQDPDSFKQTDGEPDKPKSFADRVKDAKNAEDINALVAEVKTQSKEDRAAFVAKAASLGLVYSKEQSKYIINNKK